MIRINVFIKVEAANKAKVIEAAKQLTAGSIQEAGCIAYDIFESATRPDVLMICETWKDTEALTLHQKSAHFTGNISVLSDFAQTKIEKFEF